MPYVVPGIYRWNSRRVITTLSLVYNTVRVATPTSCMLCCGDSAARANQRNRAFSWLHALTRFLFVSERAVLITGSVLPRSLSPPAPSPLSLSLFASLPLSWLFSCCRSLCVRFAFAGKRAVKIREEADPFSMDLGSVKKGDIVKILEVSETAPLVVVVTYARRHRTLVGGHDTCFNNLPEVGHCGVRTTLSSVEEYQYIMLVSLLLLLLLLLFSSQ